MEEAQNIAIFLNTHADKMLALMQSGFFEMKGGSMTVHFDALGKIRKIEKTNVFTMS